MAVVATLTLGADSYSVYALTSDALGDAKEYFSARLGAAAWNDADNPDRKRALISATRMLDRRPLWSGTVTDLVTPQPLQWPRDGATCRGDAVPDGTTPDALAEGGFELALALLEDEAIQDSPGTGSNVKRAKAGSAEVEFFVPTAGSSSETLFPQVVHELVACYFSGNAAGLAAPFVSGLDEESAFGDDDWELSEGYP